MAGLKLIIVSIVVVLIALFAFSIPLMLGKKDTLKGGSCGNSDQLRNKGISCGCGSSDSCEAE